jgi:hypothetical protein
LAEGPKLFLRGLRKLKMVIEGGPSERLLRFRGRLGYWVFEGDVQPTQPFTSATGLPQALVLPWRH